MVAHWLEKFGHGSPLVRESGRGSPLVRESGSW